MTGYCRFQKASKVFAKVLPPKHLERDEEQRRRKNPGQVLTFNPAIDSHTKKGSQEYTECSG
jgi:hypothetical protein